MTPISELPDDLAVAVLRRVAEELGVPADHASLRAIEPHVVEALRQPEAMTLAVPDRAAGPGDLARTALLVLAESDEALVSRAVEQEQAATRIDPLTATVATLVVLALRTEFLLEKDPAKGWHFRLKVTPPSASLIGRLLSQLFNNVPPPP